MLNLRLDEIARGPVRVEDEIAPDDPLWEGTELALRTPVRVDVQGRQVGDGVLVRGQMRAQLGMECRRCLTEVEQEMVVELGLLFEPGVDAAEGDDTDVYPLPERGHELDLKPALREQLLLQIPTHVVCEEACRGLCPQCGTNRNEAACDCAPEPEPGPWDALKKLKFD